MHQDSDNAMLLLACRPKWLNKQEAQSGLSLAPFGLYIYLLNAQRLHFPPRSSRITIAQAASETRGE